MPNFSTGAWTWLICRVSPRNTNKVSPRGQPPRMPPLPRRLSATYFNTSIKAACAVSRHDYSALVSLWLCWLDFVTCKLRAG